MSMNDTSPHLNLTEFNEIAAPSPNYLGTQDGTRTRKPMVYQVSCVHTYKHAQLQHLKIVRSVSINYIMVSSKTKKELL